VVVDVSDTGLKPRIIVFTSTFPRWENDTDPPFVFELCRRLTQDFDVHVLTPGYPGATAVEVFEGIQVIRFRYFFKPLEKLAGTTGILPTIRQNKLFLLVVPFFLVSSFCSLLHHSRRLRPSCIHAHWIIPQGVIAYIVGKICRTKFVVTAHGADVFGLKGGLFDWARSVVVKNATAMTVVSKALKKVLLLRCKSSCRIEILPMGVDSKAFSRNVDDKSRDTREMQSVDKLLYVGRLTEKKGVEYLIRAIPIVKCTHPEIQLTIVGSGELEDALKSTSIQCGLETNVHFLGAVPNRLLPAIYHEHSIFIAPSIEARGGDTEGFGLTLVEASMAGCLVITTGAGGITDIIKDRVTGLVVHQKSELEIARSILSALENPEQMRVIAEAGREQCNKNFDWTVVAGKYRALFKDVIGSVP
jgi:glycosyltransferase involved in cell wall biosynthesis